MIDRQQLMNNQVSDFLKEFKHRFAIINQTNNNVKLGYTTKLNRNENCNLNIYITEKFPYEPPLMYVIPKMDDDHLDENGRVTHPVLLKWNVHSNLALASRTILLHFENYQDSSFKINQNQNQNLNQNLQNNNLNNNNTNQYMNNPYNNTYNNNNINNINNINGNMNSTLNKGNFNNVNINDINSISNDKSNSWSNKGFQGNTNINYNSNNNNNNNNNNDINSSYFNNLNVDKSYSTLNLGNNNNYIQNNNINNNNINNGNKRESFFKNIESDLNNKSIEELVYILNNKEEFVEELSAQLYEPFNILKKEVDLLNEEHIHFKNSMLKDMEYLRYSERELMMKVEELKSVNNEKINIEGKFNIDFLINLLKQDIDKSNFERNKTISEFTTKKTNFNEFLPIFKEQSIKYHTNNILKDKLISLKQQNEE